MEETDLQYTVDKVDALLHRKAFPQSITCDHDVSAKQ